MFEHGAHEAALCHPRLLTGKNPPMALYGVSAALSKIYEPSVCRTRVSVKALTLFTRKLSGSSWYHDINDVALVICVPHWLLPVVDNNVGKPSDANALFNSPVVAEEQANVWKSGCPAG